MPADPSSAAVSAAPSRQRARRLRERLERFANGVAVVLGAVALAVAVAYWAWYAWGPAPASVSPSAPASPLATLRAAPLFGNGVHSAAPAAGEAVVLSGDLRLLGIIAGTDGEGYAIFRAAEGGVGNVYIARVGDSVADQATVTRIEPAAVTLREASGSERRVILRNDDAAASSVLQPVSKVAAANAPLGPAAARTTGTAAGSCTPPGFKGVVVRLNTELVQGALMQPEAFYGLLEARDGGLTVRDGNGHAAMFGLAAGDVIASANGIALKRAEDIAGTVLKPLAAGQSVLLKGQRGGQPRELLVVNAGMCG